MIGENKEIDYQLKNIHRYKKKIREMLCMVNAIIWMRIVEYK